MPVSKTNVFEKNDTRTPATKPVVHSQIGSARLSLYMHSSSLPARLPPDSCLMTSGFNHAFDSSIARDVAGEGDLDADAGKASRRIGFWRLARNMPVEILRVSGRAWRRSAPRHRATAAIARQSSETDVPFSMRGILEDKSRKSLPDCLK